MRERAKVVLGRAGPVTLIHGRYSVKSRAECLLFLLFLNIISMFPRTRCYNPLINQHSTVLLLESLTFVEAMPRKVQMQISFRRLVSIYTADVNFESASCVVVKLSVTINCLYNRSFPEWIANRTLPMMQITSSSSEQLVLSSESNVNQHSNYCTVLQCLQRTVPLQSGQRSSPGQAESGCLCQPPTFWIQGRIVPPSQILKRQTHALSVTHYTLNTVYPFWKKYK